MDTFGPVGCILEHCGIYFSVFVFLKLLLELIVMLVRYMEINRTTGASLGFGKTLLTASDNFFMASAMTSMYIPQATGQASDAPKKVDPKVNTELYKTREDAKKKEEHH